MKSVYTVPTGIILGGIIIAIAVYVSQAKPSPNTAPNASLIRPVSPSDHIFGNPAAPVMIVEYCDFDSEYCKSFNNTLAQVIANDGATGQVAWVFREFPLTELHPNALALAEAAECAASVGGSDPTTDNDVFWEFANVLFTNQPVDPSQLGTEASSVGISGEAFANCYANASSTLDARIAADRQNALEMGATGVPFSVIVTNGGNPVILQGAYPYDAVKSLIDQALTNIQ
jgi:protein-disulfide isomerase